MPSNETAVTLAGLDVPPPGAGFTTLTVCDPMLVPALTSAASWVALTKVVGRALPSNSTTELRTKPVPWTVIVKPPSAAITGLGDTLEMTGTGLLTASVRVVEVPPPGEGLKTVMARLPAVATSEDGMAAVNFVALTNVVVRAEPLTCTAEPETKLLPLTVRVNPELPTRILLGDRLESDGTALLTVNVTSPLVPTEGVTTVIESSRALARSAAVSIVVS